MLSFKMQGSAMQAAEERTAIDSFIYLRNSELQHQLTKYILSTVQQWHGCYKSNQLLFGLETHFPRNKSCLAF